MPVRTFSSSCSCEPPCSVVRCTGALLLPYSRQKQADIVRHLGRRLSNSEHQARAAVLVEHVMAGAVSMV